MIENQDGLVWVDIASGVLTGDPTNPRNNVGAIDAIAESIRRFGFAAPVVARPDPANPGHLVVVAGHTRLAAAVAAGVGRVPVRIVDLDESEGRALMLADNRLAEMATWNDPQLADLLSTLTAEDTSLDGLGWSASELDVLLDLGPGPAPIEPPLPPEAPEPPAPEEAQSKRGEIYRLGPDGPGQHRLLCGDCTQETDVAKLGPERDSVLIVDPPYCSGGFQEAGRAPGSIGTRGSETITNDNLSTRGYTALIRRMLSLAPCGVIYVFTDWRQWVSLFDTVELSGFGVRAMAVWDKGSPGMGVGWRHQHELILGALRIKSPFNPKKAQGTVIQAKRTGNVHHPTEKPVPLIQTVLAVTDDVLRVAYDPMAGSGPSLLAAANLGMAWRGIELEPAFCDVIRKRWGAYAAEVGIDPGPGAL